MDGSDVGKKPGPGKAGPGMRGTLVWVGVLYTWDALITGLPAIGLLVSMFAALANGIRGLAALVRGQGPVARLFGARAAVWMVALIAIVATFLWNTELAERNADRIIRSVEAFRADRSVYPNSLQQLVPRHLERVPRCCFRLLEPEFIYYIGHGETPQLIWQQVPPFGRRVYDFGAGRWQSVD